METDTRIYSTTQAANMVEACVHQIGKLCGIIAELGPKLANADAGIEVGADILGRDHAPF